MTVRPYITWGRNQFRIGVRYHLSGDPSWLWRFKFLGIERQW